MTTSYQFTKHKKLIDEKLKQLKKENITERLWKKDYKIWSSDPTEISNRLGWLDSPLNSKRQIKEIKSFVEEVKAEGFTHALLLGMGGSSLAPEVFRMTFGVKKGYLDLAVLDSTDPESVMECTRRSDVSKTLFIVSTKSGGTVETFSSMKFFYSFVSHLLGKENAGKHFIAITDPGSGLQKVAEELKFRKIFLNDPSIGGRYSVLSLFGIVPAALIGVKIETILNRAAIMSRECKETDLKSNSGVKVGTAIGELAKKGIDKLTFIASPQIKYFGCWLEQLIAESTGKSGKGILPVDLEQIEKPQSYSKDRAFVYFKLQDDDHYIKEVNALVKNEFPVIKITLDDLYDLGAEFMRWEIATAISGWVLKIQPFDQPNVESAKVVARELVQDYQKNGKLSEPEPDIRFDGIKIYGKLKAINLKEAFDKFLNTAISGKSYVSIQAYVKADDQTTEQLQKIRTAIQLKYKVATTVGFGPRFLHSTGQLHKGDSGNGFFIQIISENKEDLPIPDNAGEQTSSITFGVLKKAQALGDRQALLNNKRKVLTIVIENYSLEKLKDIAATF